MATVCFLLGLPGNARVLIQLYKRRDLRKVPHYLFANLSATGFLALSLNLPTLVVGLTVNYLLRQWVSTNVSNATELFCNIAGTTALAVNILNAATLSLMAIDRQDCVLRPFQRRLTQRNIKQVLLAVWIMTVVLTIPSLVTRFQETSLCQFYNSFKSNVNTPRKLYTIGLGTSLSVVTVLIITITFFRIMKRLRMNVMPQASGAQQIQQRRENQITKLTYRTLCCLSGCVASAHISKRCDACGQVWCLRHGTCQTGFDRVVKFKLCCESISEFQDSVSKTSQPVITTVSKSPKTTVSHFQSSTLREGKTLACQIHTTLIETSFPLSMYRNIHE